MASSSLHVGRVFMRILVAIYPKNAALLHAITTASANTDASDACADCMGK